MKKVLVYKKSNRDQHCFKV